jgi:FkbM family methyltransferase
MSGFFIGHRMLGDVLGFCAAAHLYSVKTGKTVKVWFDPGRKKAVEYFDGVEWVEKTPDMIDCGGDPSLAEWPSMNGVKRFYRFMDPSLSPGKSFDVHFNRVRRKTPDKLIGLVTHSVTQGDIDPVTLGEQIALARRLYPQHRIVLIGGKDNTLVPEGVEDLRQGKADIKWIIEMVESLDLLITPQSGPCFIAAGWRVPMWVYRSKESFWDNVLNYEEYKVERWWERQTVQVKTQGVVVKGVNFIVRQGTWDHSILHDSVDYSVSKNLAFPEDTCVIDVGGHIGGFTKLFATQYPKVPVYTFEPDPENFSILKENVSDLPNVTIFNKGVGAEDAVGSIEVPSPGNTGMNRLMVGSGGIEVVSPGTLFSLVKERNVGLMKIDCEGGEWGFFDRLTLEHLSRIQEIQGELHTDLFGRYSPYRGYPPFKEDFLRRLLKEKLMGFNIFLDGCRVLKAYNNNFFL